jgi:hypothetical protein
MGGPPQLGRSGLRETVPPVLASRATKNDDGAILAGANMERSLCG